MFFHWDVIRNEAYQLGISIDHPSFEQQADGFNYYLHPIAEIFYKQSQVDTWMSSSFNICFQTRNQCFSAYIHNQRNDFIEGH